MLIFVIAAFFYHFVFQNAVNVPYFDDFAYLEYVIKLQDTPNVWAFLRELEYKHNGHGVITAKLVFWLQALWTGEVNFRTLIVVGSGLVLLLFGYFVQILRVNRLPLYLSLPVALLLFTPAYHENIFWAAALWQYTASFVIGILSYYLLIQSSRWSFVAAIVAGFMLTYTNGNGLFGMYVGALIPFLQGRYFKTLLWVLACLATTFVFYWYYPFGFGSLGQERNLQHSATTLVAFLGACAHYLRGQKTEVVLLGGGVALALIGVILVLGVSYIKAILSNKKPTHWLQKLLNTPENLSLLALAAWLTITGTGVAVARASASLDTPTRYMIYSIMAFLTLYILILTALPAFWQRFTAGISTIFGVVIWVGTYLFAGPEVINFRNSLVADAYSLRHHGRVSGKLETMTNTHAQRYFSEALKRGIYRLPPDVAPPIFLTTADTTKRLSLPLQVDLDTLTAYGGILIHKIRNATLPLDESSAANAHFLVLKKDSTAYLTAVRQTPNHNRKTFLGSFKYFRDGFEAYIYQENIPTGRYQIGILTLQNGQKQVTFTPETIQIRDFRR